MSNKNSDIKKALEAKYGAANLHTIEVEPSEEGKEAMDIYVTEPPRIVVAKVFTLMAKDHLISAYELLVENCVQNEKEVVKEDVGLLTAVGGQLMNLIPVRQARLVKTSRG